MNITLMAISIYIRMKFIVALYLYRGVQFFSHVRMDPTPPGFNQYCRELMCLAQRHNKVTHVGIETRTSLFGVPHSITKTCPCNVYPHEPQFHIAKLGYAGVYLFFLFLLQIIDCGY